MNELHQFAINVANLWKIHERRQSIYKQVMSSENLGSIRKICSNGYISSLLFKKETEWIYDQVKCTLNDGHVANITNDEPTYSFMAAWDDMPSVAHLLQEQELKTIALYKRIMYDKGMPDDARIILSDHLEKIIEINRKLSKEVQKYDPEPKLIPYQKVLSA